MIIPPSIAERVLDNKITFFFDPWSNPLDGGSSRMHIRVPGTGGPRNIVLRTVPYICIHISMGYPSSEVAVSWFRLSAN